jgi:hypothetical protein
VLNSDGSAVIMVSNHAVAAASDNNGAGLTGNITIDTSALGVFTSATELMFDSRTSPTNGPAATALTTSSPISLTMNGYSAAIIKLVP